jgi:serine/threonine protein kinase/tetratricopeptide (TPR) repeat protein
MLEAVDSKLFDSGSERFKKALSGVDKCRPNQDFPGHEVLDEIGRGGMGLVYRARDIRSGRIVALKCVLPDGVGSSQLLARFRREAETAAGLDHPNIVPVYFIGETVDGLPFFTMKLASRGSLQHARERFAANPRKSILIIRKVAVALQYAHDQGVLHRDLKPANILLDEHDDPLVTDFGLAQLVNRSGDLTRALNIFGTLGYIAPEQIQGGATRATRAGDVYSIGAILFELLTGRIPLPSDNPLSFIDSARKPAPLLRSVAPGLDRRLQTICARCLETEPNDRYRSCGALASDLQSWLDDRTISARPISISTRSGRWLRRNRALAVTIGAALIATGCFSWQVHSRKTASTPYENLLALRSIAVVPILNLDNVTAEPTLAQSLADSLRHQLNILGPVSVATANIFINTTQGIKEVGRSTKSRTVLTGTVRNIHGTKRISLRLLDAATGEPLLVCPLNAPDEVSISTIIDKNFSRECYAILSAKDWSNIEQTKDDPGLRNDVAREAILAGRDLTFRYTANDFDQAITLLRKAIQAQPNSSLAHSYLASAATARTHYVADWSYLAIGEAAANKAIQLTPFSCDAHRALAGVYYQKGQFTRALEEGLRTVEASGPEEKLARLIGMTLDTLGRPDRAIGWFSLASRLHGTPGDVDAQVGDCWVKLSDDQRALVAYSRSQELQPGCAQGLVGICHMRVLEGDFGAARELQQKVQLANPNLIDSKAIAAQIEFFARNFETAEWLYHNLSETDVDGGGAFYGAVTYQSALGRAKQALDSEKSGEDLLRHCLTREIEVVQRQPESSEASYRLAAVESCLGLLKDSLYDLRKAVELGWIDYRSLALDPRFDRIRQNPDFQRLVLDLTSKVIDMKSKLQTTKPMEE